MDSLYAGVTEADAETTSAMTVTKQIASTFDVAVGTLPILDKLAMNQLMKTPAGSSKPGDFVVVFGGNADNLQDAAKGNIGCYMITDLFSPPGGTNPVGGGGVLLPLKPTAYLEDGIRGVISPAAEDAARKTLVFENIEHVLKVKDDSKS